jgi:taurine dioxygenase
MAIEVIPSSAPIGAEIRGVNLAHELDEETFQQIRDALHRHSVIVIRDQSITIPKQRAFASRFGPTEYRSGSYTVPGYTDVVCVSNILNEEGKPIGLIDAGRVWHTDSHFEPKPSMYSALYAVEVPFDDDGQPLGPTLFASTANAYDRLSDDMKARLEPLRAENSITQVFNVLHSRGFATKRPPLNEQQKSRVTVHKVIRTHPYTGRKCIYVSEGHTSHILDIPEDESRQLIDDLQKHILGDDSAIYRHRWAEGDLLMWDNCSSQHFAIGDYQLPKRRLMYRVSVAGEQTY